MLVADQGPITNDSTQNRGGRYVNQIGGINYRSLLMPFGFVLEHS